MKLLIFLGLVVTYFLTTLPLFPFYYFFPFKMRKIYSYILSFYAKTLLVLMGIKLQVKSATFLKQNNKLLVANHMSYIDVLLCAAINPGCFITSIEIKKTPVLGQICQLGGCVFVERRNKNNIEDEIKDITLSLKNNINVYVFPEATSTNGDAVIRFRKPLFQSAIDAGRDVLPFTINYMKINSLPVTKTNRDLLCWYGKMTFIDHLWSVFKLKRIDIALSFHSNLATKVTSQKPYINNISNCQTIPKISPLYLANKAHEEVSQHFIPFR